MRVPGQPSCGESSLLTHRLWVAYNYLLALNFNTAIAVMIEPLVLYVTYPERSLAASRERKRPEHSGRLRSRARRYPNSSIRAGFSATPSRARSNSGCQAISGRPVARQSRSFSSVLRAMCGHLLQAQVMPGTG